MATPIPPTPNYDKGEAPEERERKELIELLQDLEEMFDDLIKHPRPAIPGRHHKALRKAWLRTTKIREDLRGVISNTNSAPQLSEAGLGGDHLRFKLGLFTHSRDELLDMGLAGDGDPKDTSWWQRWMPRFKSVLSSAGVIVGSLAKAFPWAEPLNEFLGAVGAALELGERLLTRE